MKNEEKTDTIWRVYKRKSNRNIQKYDLIEFINGNVLCTVRTSLLLGNGPDPPITSVVFDCDNADALPSVIVYNYDRKIIVR